MRYLIDGYNLLHALGLARKTGGRAAWDRARRDLLDWLADRHGVPAGDVTVVFDAQNSLGGVVEESHRGLRVLRHRGRTADDVIEDLLGDERSPDLGSPDLGSPARGPTSVDAGECLRSAALPVPVPVADSEWVADPSRESVPVESAHAVP